MQKPTTGVAIIHDCRVSLGDTQKMSFTEKEDNSLPPFNFLSAPLEDAPDADDVFGKKV